MSERSSGYFLLVVFFGSAILLMSGVAWLGMSGLLFGVSLLTIDGRQDG